MPCRGLGLPALRIPVSGTALPNVVVAFPRREAWRILEGEAADKAFKPRFRHHRYLRFWQLASRRGGDGH